ncbi:MAG: GxxExxY protein [Gracilimonas sp.]|nr:GxxExxY protein [Gracilimonas sp.]
MTENEISKIVLDSSIQVHRSLGPGLLESAYQRCLAYELEQQGLYIEVEKGLPLVYKEVEMEIGYRVDIFVNKKVIVEIKSVDALHNIHLAQVLTYLKLSESKLGLLINFNTKLLKDGFRRVVNNL